jgi:ribosome-associated protein
MLEVSGLVGYTDWFVICTGNTERQTRAIRDAVHESLKADGLRPQRVEGEREARWILMDYLDCVLHIFTPDARSYYRLEQLWGEAPAVSVG